MRCSTCASAATVRFENQCEAVLVHVTIVHGCNCEGCRHGLRMPSSRRSNATGTPLWTKSERSRDTPGRQEARCLQEELKFKEAESKRRKRMTKELGGENAIREQWLIMFSRIEQLHSNVESLQGHSQAALEWATELLGQLTQSIAKKWLGSLVPRRSREQARAEAMLWAL